METPAKTRQEALEKGIKRYYPDEACRAGHRSGRYTKTGACVICTRKAADRWRLRGVYDRVEILIPKDRGIEFYDALKVIPYLSPTVRDGLIKSFAKYIPGDEFDEGPGLPVVPPLPPGVSPGLPGAPQAPPCAPGLPTAAPSPEVTPPPLSAQAWRDLTAWTAEGLGLPLEDVRADPGTYGLPPFPGE